MSLDPNAMLPLADMLSVLIKRFKSLGHSGPEAMTMAESLMKVSMLSPLAQAPMLQKTLALTGALVALVEAVEAEGGDAAEGSSIAEALARAQSVLNAPAGG